MSAMHPEGSQEEDIRKSGDYRCGSLLRRRPNGVEGEGAQAVWGAEARAEDCFRKGGKAVSRTSCLH